MSTKSNEDKQKKITRRGFIKWTTALAAVGAAVVGLGVGYGADQVLRPTTEKTTTETATSTATKTATSTATQTQTATQTATVTQTVTQGPPQGETLLTMAGDGGPFYAHVVNGQWIKSSALAPNLPVSANTYYGRNRSYAADRIRYPMIRVDFDPTGNRNTQNRGKSGFVRISWDQALTIVANELTRVKNTYGVGAVLATPTDHQWIGNLHNSSGAPSMIYSPGISGGGWGSRFWSLFGGCSIIWGGQSNPGNYAAGPLAIGMSAATSWNNVSDILANSKMVIHWGTDTAIKNYAGYRQLLVLKQFQQAGIKQVVIDPFYNDTAGTFGAQWIPIVPNTDEALLAAIAYVWFTNNLINEQFATSHVYGYPQFKSYVLGTADGTPKTPQWASQITKVPVATITQLAQDWASKPTYIMHASANAGDLGGGINRRTNGIQALRMMIGMSAISGNVGVPGGGQGGWNYTTAGAGQKSFGGIPGMTVNVVNMVPHIWVGDAILNPPVDFASVGTDGKWYAYTYPNKGTPEAKLIALHSDNGFVLNQQPGLTKKVQGFQSPKIEFVFCMGPWWGPGAKMADVVLPTRFLGERDDITMWENYAVYLHTVCNPVPEAWNDLDIYTALANKLGFGSQFTGDKTPDQWLQELYAASSVPLSFSDFQKAGFYKFPDPVQKPTVLQFASFNQDPVKNPLKTKSGLVELYSDMLATMFGADSPYALAKYVTPTEGSSNPLAATYPLIMLTPHPKNARHSQWQNIGWVRTNDQMFRNGYRTAYVNTVDANQRSIKDGDVVRVFNQRSSTICTATVTERAMPGTVYIWEGAWFQPQTPGDPTTADIGGNIEALIDPRLMEMTTGMLANALVNIEKWSGQ